MASEQSDVNVRAIFTFGAGLAGVGVVVSLVVFLLFSYLSRREDRAVRNAPFPMTIGRSERVPPEPRLQTNPRQDLKDLRDAEHEVLNGYWWVDRNAGIVRIPIDEAMKLTLQRGLPARPQPPEAVKIIARAFSNCGLCVLGVFGVCSGSACSDDRRPDRRLPCRSRRGGVVDTSAAQGNWFRSEHRSKASAGGRLY